MSVEGIEKGRGGDGGKEYAVSPSRGEKQADVSRKFHRNRLLIDERFARKKHKSLGTKTAKLQLPSSTNWIITERQTLMQEKIGKFFLTAVMAITCAFAPTLAIADQTYGSDTETIDGERTQAHVDIDNWCDTAKLVLNDVQDGEIAQLLGTWNTAHANGGHFANYSDYHVAALDGGIYAERGQGIYVLSLVKATLDKYGISLSDIEDYARDKHEARVIKVYMTYKLLPLLDDKDYAQHRLFREDGSVNASELRSLYNGTVEDTEVDTWVDDYAERGFVSMEQAALDHYYEEGDDSFGSAYYTDQHPNEGGNQTTVYHAHNDTQSAVLLRGKYDRLYDQQQRNFMELSLDPVFDALCTKIDGIENVVNSQLFDLDAVGDIDLDHDDYTGESDYKAFRKSLYDVCVDDDTLYCISAYVMERLSDNRYIINDKLGRDHLEDLTLLHLVAEYDGRLSDLHNDANTFESNMQQAKPAFESSLFPNNAEGNGYLYDAGADCNSAEEFSERLFGAHTAGQYAAAPTHQSFIVPLWNRYCDLKSKTEAVTAQINALPENVTLEHREFVGAVYQAYSALTDNQRKDVARATNDKIISALTEIHTEERHVSNFLSVMNRLPDAQDVALSDAEAIERCQRAYNNLTNEERDYAGDVSRLTNAVNALENLTAQTETPSGGTQVADSGTNNAGSGTKVADSGANTVTMLRAYNPNSGEHLYTASAVELKSVVAAGWKSEGTAWKAPATGKNVYRVYNPNSGLHHYTTSTHERDELVRLGWKCEGVCWHDAGSGVAVHRLYNPNDGQHHYTTSAHERDALTHLGWKYEGVAWYGVL